MSLVSVVSPLRPRLVSRRLSQASSALIAALGLAIALTPGVARAQNPGTQDKSFFSDAIGGTAFTLTLETIDEVNFVYVGGDAGLSDRLNSTDGSSDPNFDFANFGDEGRIIYTSVEQIIPAEADQDKLLVGGLFGKTPVEHGSDLPSQNITRLNSNGDLDTSFNPGKGANDYVTAILPQADGSMFVGGQFIRFNEISHLHLVRLNIDGSINTSFSSSLSTDDTVLNLANQIDPVSGEPNGQVLVVGTFNRVNQQNAAKIARLNSDGSLDTSFNPSINDRVDCLAVQPDGRILIGGEFQSVNGTSVQRLVRLNQDGSLDPNFSAAVTGNPPGSPTTTAVYVINLLSDGRMYVGGNFVTVDGVTRNYLALLHSDGSLDTSFDPGTAIINSVQSLAIQPGDFKVVVGETISRKVDNIFPAAVIRLYGVTPQVVPPVVTISATKPNAVESSKTHGQFELVRVGDNLTGSTSVYLQLSGSAVLDTDYTTDQLHHVKNTAATYRRTFLPGQRVIKLGIRPTGDTLSSSPAAVTVTVVPDESGSTTYTVGSPDTATVSISN